MANDFIAIQIPQNDFCPQKSQGANPLTVEFRWEIDPMYFETRGQSDFSRIFRKFRKSCRIDLHRPKGILDIGVVSES
jgi:hypothetical protein